MYLGVVESLRDEDVLQTLKLLGLLTLTLDIAAVLDEDLGTLDDLLTTRRDGFEGTAEGVTISLRSESVSWGRRTRSTSLQP